MTKDNVIKWREAVAAMRSNINDLMAAREEAMEAMASDATGVVLAFKATIALDGPVFVLDVDLSATATAEKIKDTRHVEGEDPNQPSLGLEVVSGGGRVAQQSEDVGEEPSADGPDDPFGGKPAPDAGPDANAQPPPPADGQADDPFGPAVAPLEKRKGKKK